MPRTRRVIIKDESTVYHAWDVEPKFTALPSKRQDYTSFPGNTLLTEITELPFRKRLNLVKKRN
jgi:hypothetical protein